jgi:diaminopimelate decarboxylase
VTRVESEKTKRRRDHQGRVTGEERWLLVDAGYNTFFDPVLYGWYYPLVSVSRPGEPAEAGFRLAGPLCDGGDVYAATTTPRPPLPASTAPGDRWRSTTLRHTAELMTPYNAWPTAAACDDARGGAAHPRRASHVRIWSRLTRNRSPTEAHAHSAPDAPAGV